MTRKLYLPNRSQETRDKKFKQTISRQKRKIIKELSFPKKPDLDDFTREFYQIFRDQAILMLLHYPRKENEGNILMLSGTPQEAQHTENTLGKPALSRALSLLTRALQNMHPALQCCWGSSG